MLRWVVKASICLVFTNCFLNNDLIEELKASNVFLSGTITGKDVKLPLETSLNVVPEPSCSFFHIRQQIVIQIFCVIL